MPSVKLLNEYWKRTAYMTEFTLKRLNLTRKKLVKEFLNKANPENMKPEQFTNFSAREIIRRMKERKSYIIRSGLGNTMMKQSLETIIKDLEGLQGKLETISHEIQVYEAMLVEFKKAANKRNGLFESGIGPDAPSGDTPTDTDDWLKEKLMEQMD